MVYNQDPDGDKVGKDGGDGGIPLFLGLFLGGWGWESGRVPVNRTERGALKV